jgi:hypothetical protein
MVQGVEQGGDRRPYVAFWEGTPVASTLTIDRERLEPPNNDGFFRLVVYSYFDDKKIYSRGGGVTRIKASPVVLPLTE